MANRIKELRLKNHLSQQELAERTGISNQSISFYENSKRVPKIEAWEKMALVFGVSVPYLQGKEPDFSIITNKTKLTMSLVLDNYYFGQKYNHILSYRIGKEIFNVDNLDEKEWKSTFSKCQISIAESRQTYNYVNQYINLIGLNKEPVPADKNYWLKNFAFLLKKERLVELINRELFRKSKIEAGSAIQLVYTCDRLAHTINKNLYRHIIENFSTDLGNYINHGSYRIELDSLDSNFSMSLRTADSIQSMRKAISNYENGLNDLIDKVQLDESNGKLEKYIERESKRKKVLQQAKNFHNEFDELYSKNKEFKDFARNYEEKHPVGIQLVDETTGKVVLPNHISMLPNHISRRNKIPCLYEYKKIKNEDTADLHKFLQKFGNIF